MKAVILDSGPLINLSMNGLLYIIKELKEKTGVRFFITKDVKYETLDRPIGVPRFELGAPAVSGQCSNQAELQPHYMKICLTLSDLSTQS